MINRLSHSRLGDISFIALVTISYFVPHLLHSLVTKYDIISRAIKLISPRLSYERMKREERGLSVTENLVAIAMTVVKAKSAASHYETPVALHASTGSNLGELGHSNVSLNTFAFPQSFLLIFMLQLINLRQIEFPIKQSWFVPSSQVTERQLR